MQEYYMLSLKIKIRFKEALMLGLTLLGLEPARFTQLKRHTRFDDFVMLVWGQESMFHIAAVSLPVK